MALSPIWALTPAAPPDADMFFASSPASIPWTEVRELDINPFFARPDGVVATDVRILIKEPGR